MREILFRGKRQDNGEWTYGSFVPDLLEVYATTDEQKEMTDWGFIKPFGRTKEERLMCEVERNSVGQYTGLTDKNGNRIFEGDVLFVKTELESLAKETRHDEYTTKGVVVFENGTFILQGKGMVLCTYWGLKCLNSAVKFPEYEIIGNMHDNPDLAKECEI